MLGLVVKSFPGGFIDLQQEQQERQESNFDIHLSFPYFDAPRMLIVDPMFLGSAKRVLHDIWIDRNVLSYQQFKVVQKWVDCIKE